MDFFQKVNEMQGLVLAGSLVYPTDDPMRRTVGFATNYKTWDITLTEIKSAVPKDPHQRKILELMKTGEGRRNLCDYRFVRNMYDSDFPVEEETSIWDILKDDNDQWS